jgi:hypothetical protein
LLDPQIDVRPSKNQIDDLLEEIDERVQKAGTYSGDDTDKADGGGVD